jgi:hypothetical protein
MAVQIIKDKELWDAFVDESPYGLLFHKWDFLNIMEKHSGYKLFPYGIYKGDELIAIFPLFFKKLFGLKTIFSPPPKTGVPYLGFIVNKEYDNLKQNKKEGLLNLIVNEIDEEIKNFSPNYVLILTVPNFLDIRPLKWNKYNIDIHFTYVIDLNRTINQIFDSFKTNLRKYIKRSERSSLELSESNDLSIFWELHKTRYEEQGINYPLISENYLSDLIKAYPQNIKLYYLQDNNREIISTSITQEYKTFLGWQGLPKIKIYGNPKIKIYGNEWMLWKLIQKAKSENYKEFDMVGANTKHLCMVKSQFNPTLEFYFAIYQKDVLGKIAEWGYSSFIKRRWL